MFARGEPEHDAEVVAGPSSKIVKQHVREHFSSVSDRYHEKNYIAPAARGQYPDILMRHHRILEMVQTLEGRALDVGCGSGRLLLDLQRRGFDVTGVDYSPAMVEASRSLLLRAGSSAMPELAVGDIERLGFEDGTFDLVIAAGVIEYLASDERAIAEMRRVLRPGGVAILSVRNRVNLSRPLILLRDVAQEFPVVGRVLRGAHRAVRHFVPGSSVPYWPDVRYHVPWKFSALLKRNGFEIEEKAAYHFAVCPPLLRRLAPQASIRIGLALEKFARTALGNFAGAYVVKVRATERQALPVSHARPLAQPSTFPPAVIVRLGVTGLGVARSLTHRRVPGKIPLVGVDSSFSRPSTLTRLCTRHELEEIDSPPVIARLVELARTFAEKPVLFLTDDATVLRVSAEEDRLRPYYRFVLPPMDSVRVLADKTAFSDYARSHGFRIPRTFVIRGEEDLEHAAGCMAFPSILKPAWRSTLWESLRYPKAFILTRPEELSALYRTFSPVHPTYVMQEWIPGPDSEIYYCLVYFDADSRCLASFTGRKIRQWPVGAGNTSITEPFPCPEIERETVRLFETVGFRGLGSVEFKRDPRDGAFKIMEPTVGRPNLQSEIATANGVNLAWLAYANLSGIDPGPRMPPPAHPVRWVHEVTDVRSALQLVREGKLSLRELARTYRGPKHYALFSWRDPRPFLETGRRSGMGMARRALRRLTG